VPDPIRFSEDKTHAAYDPEYACRFWRILLQVDRLFKLFRTGFIGKCSPVHFFWGSFDLAVTRFSGRSAPVHPGGIPNLSDEVVREAYSHEVSSAGFWPGGGSSNIRRFILILIQNLQVSARPLPGRRAHSTASSCESSSCPTM
jgi:Family of unknown function (DUF5996)